jgi:ribonuclease PH
VGVHHIQALAAVARSQCASGREQGARAGSKLEELDIEVLKCPQRSNLVAHETAALGMAGVGEHVGEHQRTQHPLNLALWNDGSHDQPLLEQQPVSAPARSYGRTAGDLRPISIEPGFMRTATGSALISAGETRVICTASAQESVPRWMAGKGRGWLTAEYGMLPASTSDRKQRDISKGRLDGRSVEIQRLIGRSLRGVIDLSKLGERTIYLDCDVLQADGGTRCASITGAYVALALACARLRSDGLLEGSPLTGSVAAVSCGMVEGIALLDLDYSEDSTAEVDANVVMTGEGGLIEVQATAERTPLSRAHLDELLALAAVGIERLRVAQEQAITPS